MASPFAARLAPLRPALGAKWTRSLGPQGGARAGCVDTVVCHRRHRRHLQHRSFARNSQGRALAPDNKGPVPFPSDKDLARPVQVYDSDSEDPYLNLAFEHHLLQHTHPDSTVLFLYTNRPCVVVGRNQNPWLETDLRWIRRGINPDHERSEGGRIDPVDLVRRRSGGGTVFHDGGNLNWAVICPTANFDRARHAGMVARTLQRVCAAQTDYATRKIEEIKALGEVPWVRSYPRKTFRVNERNDIMMEKEYDGVIEGLPDVPASTATATATATATNTAGSDSAATGSSLPEPSQRPMPLGSVSEVRPRVEFKVSGSAYKITRQRALHHGTCLLISKHIRQLMRLLGPAAEVDFAVKSMYSGMRVFRGERGSNSGGGIASYVQARGVESVKSMISNIILYNPQYFTKQVVAQFCEMYRDQGGHGVDAQRVLGEPKQAGDDLPPGLPRRLVDGYRELRSAEWIYGQTPQFVFSTESTPEDARLRRPEWKAAFGVPRDFTASMTIRHGVIEQASMAGFRYGDVVDQEVRKAWDEATSRGLVGRRLWEMEDWADALRAAGGVDPAAGTAYGDVGNWLNFLFGRDYDHTQVRRSSEVREERSERGR